MGKFKVGDVVEYFPSYYKERSGEFIGTVITVNEESEYCEVEYPYNELDKLAGIEESTWIDLEPFCNIVKLTKLEKALK